MTSLGMRAASDGVVLVVDDNAADADLTREALAESALVDELHVVGDGVEALAFLRREGAFARAPVPRRSAIARLRRSEVSGPVATTPGAGSSARSSATISIAGCRRTRSSTT